MKFKCLAILITSALLLSGAAIGQDGASKTSQPVQSPAANDPNYVIGAEDLLAISVWKEPDLTRSVPVRPDGKISLPLIDEVKAEGLTPKQLETELTKRFSQYIASPQVSVIVADVRSRTFSIVGEVNRPGSFPLRQKLTVLEALAAAGGFKDFAKTKRIYVLRLNADGTRSRLPFSYNRVIKGEETAQNVELQSHDTIVVP
ncbi:MAG TPA: polysaccharide biosynthesis/export family protein [Clostridia bacterium]|nr:polysaccharide biosynthesis/export family protein [Clostridia bacterium]